MKSIFVLLFLFSGAFVYSQSFHSLDGIENQQNETILLYRLGSNTFQYNPVYKFNTSTLTEELIINAFYNNYPTGEITRSAWDFEYFPDDEINFMNVGDEINPDNHSYIARNDTSVFGGFNVFSKVDISRQNPNKVFAFGEGIRRSFNSGYTFPEDSVINTPGFFYFALDRNNENYFYGTDNSYSFIKNGAVVDTSKVFFDHNFKMLFDIDQLHVYRVNRSYGCYTVNVSHTNGNAFTWTKTYTSENPLYLTDDSSVSGTLYLADGNIIYKSINDYGYNFVPYRSLPYRIKGIYKKPGEEVLYAATKYKLYKITQDTSVVIKSLPVPTEVFDWFPLAIGNKWIYTYTVLEDCWIPVSITEEVTEIKKDTVIGGKTYFKMDQPLSFEYEFMRIDSAEGKLLSIDNTTEITVYDFLMDVGDTVLFNPPYPYSGYVLLGEEERIIFNEDRIARDLMPLAFLPPPYTLVKGIGYYEDFFCEFGGLKRLLKGCVINGIVHGDTTLVGVNDFNNMPIEFNLYQNYPNPFNPSTKIRYSIPYSSLVTIKIYDLLGREVITLVNSEMTQGIHEIEWNAEVNTSGVYICRLQAGEYRNSKKLILLK